jgi:glycogen synthase
MKVLMFGWEFPPHISGGLGTACYGLTKSLMQEGIQILFVVPRAYGDEELNLVDASNILISEPGRTMVAPETADQLRQTGMELIHVYSGLKPYCPVSSTGEMYAVEEWSYRINTGSSTKPGFKKRKAKKYKFTAPMVRSCLKRWLVIMKWRRHWRKRIHSISSMLMTGLLLRQALPLKK